MMRAPFGSRPFSVRSHVVDGAHCAMAHGRRWCIEGWGETPAAAIADAIARYRNRLRCARRGVDFGQLWEVGGQLFRVIALNGSDAAYPILMIEVAVSSDVRCGREQALARTNLRRFQENWPPRACMEQQLRWFDRRDVRRWNGTVDEWTAAHDAAVAS